MLTRIDVALGVGGAVCAPKAVWATARPQRRAGGILDAGASVGTCDPHTGVHRDFATLPREERGTGASKILVSIGGTTCASIEAATITNIERNCTIWPRVVCWGKGGGI